jgi:hypothetical protein
MFSIEMTLVNSIINFSYPREVVEEITGLQYARRKFQYYRSQKNILLICRTKVALRSLTMVQGCIVNGFKNRDA